MGEGFYVINPDISGWTAEALTSVLNSPVAWFWLLKHKHKGSRLQVDKDVLCDFPLPDSGTIQDVFSAYGLTDSDFETISAALNPLSTQSFNETPVR